jgi:dihydrofolate reductase
MLPGAEEERSIQFTAFVAVSLDGFYCRRNGAIDFLDAFTKAIPPNTDLGIEAYNSSLSALVLGRKTFEYVVANSLWTYNCPVIVLSRTLKDLPQSAPASTLLCQDFRQVLDVVKRHDWSMVGVDGGEVVKLFVRERLLDEITITTIPVLLSHGFTLGMYGPTEQEREDMWLKLIESKMFDVGPGCVQSIFRFCRRVGNNQDGPLD